MGKTRRNFYAVRVGRQVGVYDTWEECREQVSSYSGAVFKKFSTAGEAESFVGASNTSRARSLYGGHSSSSSSTSSSSSSTKSYGHYRPRKHYAEPKGSRAFLLFCPLLPASLKSMEKMRTPRASGYSMTSWGSHLTSYSSYSDDHSTASSSSAPPPLPLGHSSSHSWCAGKVSTRPTVYSDGCCFNNGRRGARAGIGVYWDTDSPHNVSEKLDGTQTNQRAELVAAYRAVQSAVDRGLSTVEVKTDSMYTIKAMTEWLNGWKRNGWKTSTAAPVKNKEDIVRLDDACQKVNVKWTHVPGHHGVVGNEEADKLAKAGSLK